MEKETAYDMYKLFRNEMYESVKLHQQSLQNYLALSSAILGVTIAGVLQVKGDKWVGLVIILAPVLNIFVCKLAMQMCDRFYLGALERIPVISKLEVSLGLWGRVDLEESDQQRRVLFPKDASLVPERWVRDSHYETSGEFTQKAMNAGTNKFARQTFQTLIGINCLLGIAVIFIAFH